MYLAIGIIVAAFVFMLVSTQRAIATVTEAKQAQEMEKLLGGVRTVCEDTNHPEVTNMGITVFGEHQILFRKDSSEFEDYFDSKETKDLVETSCKKNCLCAFNKENPIQCVSMLDQKSTSCQNIEIKQVRWGGLGSMALELPNDILGSESYSCQYQLKLKWEKGSPNKVIAEIVKTQPLTYTYGAESLWHGLNPDWAPGRC